MTDSAKQPVQAQSLLPGGDAIFDSMLTDSMEAAGLQSPVQEQGETGEPESAQERKLWAGKYETPEEMEKGLLHLQRKLSEKGSEPEPAGRAPYTLAEATEIYGPTVAEAAQRAGLDLADWASAVEAGGDTAQQREALARELGISPSVIEQYERSFRPDAPPPAPDTVGDEVKALKQLAGGDAGWDRLSTWAAENLSTEEIAVTNKALEHENPAVAEHAVRTLLARASAQEGSHVEPISGTPAGADVFQNEEEVLLARMEKDGKGRLKYETDPKFRTAYEQKLARSAVFR